MPSFLCNRPAVGLAVMCLIFAALAACQGSDRRLAENGDALALTSQRLTTPRLAGHAHQPCGDGDPFRIGFCSPIPRPGDLLWSHSLQTTPATAAGSSDAGEIRNRGVGHLAWHEVDRAIGTLQEALELTPSAPRLLNDLAVALVLRSLTAEDPLLLVEALETVERALDAAAREGVPLPEGLFNRALVLSHLGLHHGAMEAWDAYLATDLDSPWTGEARAWQDHLRASEVPPWTAQKIAFEKALREDDQRQLDTLVRLYPEEVRLYADGDLLGAWGRARAWGESMQAFVLLASARRLAESRRRVFGDTSTLEAVKVIENALDAPSTAPLAALATGHLELVEGLEALAAGDSKAGLGAFRRARRAFEGSGSPYAAQSELEALRCLYRQGRITEVAQRAGDLLAEVGTAPYVDLKIRSLWIEGSTLLPLGRTSEGLRAYERGLEVAKTHQDLVRAGILQTLTASAYGELGDLVLAWHHRRGALRALTGRWTDPRWSLAVAEAAYGAQQLHRPWAAFRLQREVVALADLKADPLQQVIARRNLGAIEGHLGHLDAAFDTLRLASNLTPEIVDPEQRHWAEVDLRFEEARWMASQNPQAAVERLSEALVAYGESDFEIFVPWVLQERAAARRRLDDATGAISDLSNALDRLDHLRSLRLSQPHRFAFVDGFQGIYDDLLQLQVEGNDPRGLIATMERSRSRLLLDRLGQDPRSSDSETPWIATPRPLEDLLPQLPTEPTYLLFHSLPRRLLLIVIRDGEVQAVESVEVTAADLQRRVAQLASAQVKQLPQRLAALSDLLLRPITQHLRRGQPLVLVPHGALFGLPFAALSDTTTGRYLAQDYPLLVVPSLNVLVELQHRARGAAPLPLDGLILADPAFDRRLFPPELQRLPGAAEEGLAVAEQLQSSKLLQGAEASRLALLRHMGRFPIVHLGAHGLADTAAPLRSRLALAPEGEDSGVLYAEELVSGVSLQQTRLVVLAACRSAEGGSTPSEGVTGLVWPLLAGGVPQVVATVLPIDDGASSAFMERFYRHLAEGREPLNALHGAQVESLAVQSSDPRPNPLDWAAFQLYGSLWARSSAPEIDHLAGSSRR